MDLAMPSNAPDDMMNNPRNPLTVPVLNITSTKRFPASPRVPEDPNELCMCCNLGSSSHGIYDTVEMTAAVHAVIMHCSQLLSMSNAAAYAALSRQCGGLIVSVWPSDRLMQYMWIQPCLEQTAMKACVAVPHWPGKCWLSWTGHKPSTCHTHPSGDQDHQTGYHCTHDQKMTQTPGES